MLTEASIMRALQFRGYNRGGPKGDRVIPESILDGRVPPTKSKFLNEYSASSSLWTPLILVVNPWATGSGVMSSVIHRDFSIGKHSPILLLNL
jgi:hypothetical protein